MKWVKKTANYETKIEKHHFFWLDFYLVGFLLVFILTILYTVWQLPGILGICEHGIQLNLSTDEVQIIEEAIEVDFPEDTSINMIYGGVSGYQPEVAYRFM